MARFQQFESSIAHTSIQIAAAHLKLREMESGLSGLYEGRQQLLASMFESNDIIPSKVASVHISETGEMTVILAPDPVAPAP